jgi:hypothetical protein
MNRHRGRLLFREVHFNSPKVFGWPRVLTGNTKLRSEETGRLGLATADKEESAELHDAVRIA